MAFSKLVAELGSEIPLPYRNRFFLSSCTSTNELGRALLGGGSKATPSGRGPEAENQAAEPILIVAETQQSGRGRRGNRWESPVGGAYVTIVLPGIPLSQLHLLPLRTGIALCSAIEEILSRPCRLKWPNDLMVEERKIGGVLIESVSRHRDRSDAVVGFGVNHRTAPVGLPYPATAISREIEEPPRLSETIRILVSYFARQLESPASSTDVISRYQAVSAHAPGDSMTCNTDSGTVCGTFLGFDRRGFLRLEVDGCERIIDTAEVMPLIGRSPR